VRRVGGLFESVCSFPALHAAARLAARGKKRSLSVARFLWNLEEELFTLESELRAGAWKPGQPHRFLIRDPKERVITAAPFRDRVVHHALCAAIGPVLERGAIDHSYACRVGKGTHAAVEQCRRLAGRWSFFLKSDIHRFFATVDHGVLKTRLRRVLKDRHVLGLCDTIVDAGAGSDQISHGGCLFVEPAALGPPTSRQRACGLPIGNLTSQHFANFYLCGFDHFVLEQLRPGGYLRYMDDFILFDDDRGRLKGMLGDVRRHLAGELSLDLNQAATLLTRTVVGIPFLGLRTFPRLVRVRRRKAQRFSRMLRRRLKESHDGQVEELRLQSSLGALVAHVEAWSPPGFRRRVLASFRAGTKEDRG